MVQRQFELFEVDVTQLEELGGLIDRLASQFGAEAVTFARLVEDCQPEYAYRFEPAIAKWSNPQHSGKARPALRSWPAEVVPDGPPSVAALAGAAADPGRGYLAGRRARAVHVVGKGIHGPPSVGAGAHRDRLVARRRCPARLLHGGDRRRHAPLAFSPASRQSLVFAWVLRLKQAARLRYSETRGFLFDAGESAGFGVPQPRGLERATPIAPKLCRTALQNEFHVSDRRVASGRVGAARAELGLSRLGYHRHQHPGRGRRATRRPGPPSSSSSSAPK